MVNGGQVPAGKTCGFSARVTPSHPSPVPRFFKILWPPAWQLGSCDASGRLETCRWDVPHGNRFLFMGGCPGATSLITSSFQGGRAPRIP